MPTKEELIKIYRNYDDEKLIELYGDIDSYTEEAKFALAQVITEVGGLGPLKLRTAEKEKVTSEKHRIAHKANKLFNKNQSIEEVKQSVQSDLLSQQELILIIEDCHETYVSIQADKRIKPKTFIGGIIGGLLGGTISGCLLGYYMIVSGMVYSFVLLFVILACYFFVWLFTKQSRRNVVVVICTVVSVAYALVLGQVVYEIFSPV
jgi:hypothetical protein